MMTLYYCPYACSMASHVALEEAGATFETKKVNIFKGEQFSSEYRVINPRAKVPALRFDDGRVLLESVAILSWIGTTYLEGSLLGSEPIDQARTIALCGWLSGTVHATFKHFLHPENQSSDGATHASIKATAKESYWAYLREIDAMLAADHG